MILAVDTSTAQASVALMTSGEVRAELTWLSPSRTSSTLTHAIRTVLEVADTTLSDLTAVVVARGPGSFSGIRVGLSETKGLAMALDLSLLGISTLDAIGFQSMTGGRPVLAALSAGRNEVYCATYRADADPFRRTSDYLILSIADAAMLAAGAVVAGDAADEVVSAARQMGVETTADRPENKLRRAGYLAELGRRRLTLEGADQRDTLEPLYLRRSSAEEKRASGAPE